MKFKVNKEMLVSGGLVVLGVAQMILNNKKQSNDLAALENKVTEKVMETLKEKN